MPEVKLVVAYPKPRDADAFERVYRKEHVPMAKAMLTGATKFVFTKIIAAADGGTPAFHQIVEVYFPSMDALQSCMATEGAKETAAHAIAISTGGPPLILIAETETFAMEG